MKSDNLYHSFLKTFEQYQSFFDDCGYQYFLVGVHSFDGQNILTKDISSIAKNHNKKVLVINNPVECNYFVDGFLENKKELNHQLIIVNIFDLDKESTTEMIKKLSSAERDLKKNKSRIVFSFSTEQYQQFISHTEFFQFRSTTYFDENDLIKSYSLYRDLNSNLEENESSKKKIKI